MPSKSMKQHRTMQAVAHNPEFAKKIGIPQSVGKDFADADKRDKKFAAGGSTDFAPIVEPRNFARGGLAAYSNENDIPPDIAAELQELNDEEQPNHAVGGPIKMGHFRMAPSAPTQNDPIMAHLMRYAPRPKSAPPPIRYAKGGSTKDFDHEAANATLSALIAHLGSR